jgi:hypothetical protein
MTTQPRTRKSSAAKTGTTTRRRRPAPAQNPVAEVEIPKVRQTEGYTVDLQSEGEETSRTWEKLLAKEPNDTHREFQAWFEEQTGESLDLKTIQFTLATYAEFQRSPEHKAKVQEQRRASAERRAKAEASKVQRAKAAAEKAGLKVVESQA